LVDKALKIKS